MDPRNAFQPNGSALPAPTTTPVAPHASAARMIAPTLPGSCTCSSISTICGAPPSASSSEHSRRRATATTPDGWRTGLIAASTAGVTVSTRAPAASARHASAVISPLAPSSTATRSTGSPAASASPSRCAPSSRISSSAAAIAARKRLTAGFWRLVIKSIVEHLIWSKAVGLNGLSAFSGSTSPVPPVDIR